MKKIFYTFLLISPLLFVSSCDKGPIHGCLDSQAYNYNPEASIDNNSCEYLEIGSIFQGGIIFYIDETGQHGLVAANEDLEGDFEWGCNGMDLDVDGQVIGTGLQNTMDIIADCLETPIAASEALAYEAQGLSDWYLPSKDELVQMYNTIGNGGLDGNIGGFDDEEYWSSSEFNTIIVSAWYVRFGDGYAGSASKTEPINVRPIRSF